MRTSDNQILRFLPRAVIDTLQDQAVPVEVEHGKSLFEPGDEIKEAHFPLGGAVIALVLPMTDGRAVEAATIGREGAVGGIISLGLSPAYSRAVVQIGGGLVRIPIEALEAAKCAAPRAHDIFARYADCLTAQVLQSVGCAALHRLEARCARWLLLTHDRLRIADLPLTQEQLAETLGVARTYVTRVAGELQDRGAIRYRRGVIQVVSRSKLEALSCECYWSVRHHFERVLPGLYPSGEQ